MKYKDMNDKQRIKSIKRRFYFLFGCFLFMAGAFFYVYFQTFSIPLFEKEYEDIEVSELNIEYIDLSEEEIKFVESIFEDINPLYLYKQDEIIITKNMSEWCDDCVGANIGHGSKVIIKYRNNEDSMKRTITHEFIHSYFSKNFGDTGIEDPQHAIIYDLGDKLVAFE